MHIALVGGIFHASPSDRALVQATTEVILSRELRSLGHEVTELSPRSLAAVPRFARSALDVVHIHHPGRMTTVVGMTPRTVPVVYTPHRTDLPSRPVLEVGHRALLRRANRVVALSPAEAEFLQNRRHVRPDHIALIPNGLDPKHFDVRRRVAPQWGGKWTVLYVGQVIDAKRPWAILDAIDHPSLRGRVRVRYVFHRGDGLDRLRSEIQERGLEDLVHLVGRREGQALATEYQSAHFLALPSKTEALPSVITEAVFTGLPVIAADVGGIRWQLDGFGSCLSRVDGDCLRGALLEAMNRYSEHVEAGLLAATAFRERFGVEQMVGRHLQMYSEVVEEVKR